MTLTLTKTNTAIFVFLVGLLGAVIGHYGALVSSVVLASIAMIAALKLRQIGKAQEAADADEEISKAKYINDIEFSQVNEGPQHNRVHVIEITEGKPVVDWSAQMQEIKDAWSRQDYDFARNWLQKLAYSITSEKAPKHVHDDFKALMVSFTKEDPIYIEVMQLAKPEIANNPGIIQSVLSKQYPEIDSEQFRYVMYFAAESGEIIREKAGRSYALHLA